MYVRATCNDTIAIDQAVKINVDNEDVFFCRKGFQDLGRKHERSAGYGIPY